MPPTYTEKLKGSKSADTDSQSPVPSCTSYILLDGERHLKVDPILCDLTTFDDDGLFVNVGGSHTLY